MGRNGVASITSLYNIGDVDLTATAALSERIGTMIYVISKDGNPLMPTKRHGKVKHMLFCVLADGENIPPHNNLIDFRGTV